MKNLLVILLVITCMLTACKPTPAASNENALQNGSSQTEYEDAVNIILSEDSIQVDGNEISGFTSADIYKANDIVYYPAGKDFTFGEGTDADTHSEEEAAKHTVVHITKPGIYAVSGTLPYGQIAIDLGEDAEDNPEAKVTLILNGLDINCTVAPAVIFYNVYECSSKDEETATKDVDTTAAGANVIIADGTVNNVSGSYVARIYKSVELNEEGTEVVDSKKLHKYDAAFYSKMTMNVNGGTVGDGVLNINAENEGLDSEQHLTINGGNINISSGNDGINTNEDYISVTTLNGGNVNIVVEGTTGEGDGIDSNGWLVINGGTLNSAAYGYSGDAGIDSDMGIYINGGNISASGNMLDRISGGDATFVVFSFASRQKGGETYSLRNDSGETVFETTPANDFSYLIISNDSLTPGTYTLWNGKTQLAASAGNADGMGGGMPGGMGGRPDAIRPDGERHQLTKRTDRGEQSEMRERPGNGFPERPDDKTRPEMPISGRGETPENMPESENGGRPQGDNHGGRIPGFGSNGNLNAESQITEFSIAEGGNYFSFVSIAE